MEKVLGFLTPVIVYIFIFILSLMLPGRRVKGYITRKNSTEKLSYRLNGPLVLLAVVATWIILCRSGILAWDWLYVHRWYALAGGISFGLVFSCAIVFPFAAVRKSLLADFYLGRLENPQLWNGKIDAKMWLYLVGAIMLELNILGFAAHHYLLFGINASPGIYLSTALLSFFVIDYLIFEEVHLYTYDFLAERVGFKLGWGNTAFYPFFYSISVWSAVDLPDPGTKGYMYIIYITIFLTSWGLSRGANLQKYTYKKNPGKSFLGISPVTISDGNKSLLVNGFWGVSRHINYLGEIGMAIAIVLCSGNTMSLWPWLYPLYYIALLFPRQASDDKRCAAKYGSLWTRYIEKVPYRIIPGIY